MLDLTKNSLISNAKIGVAVTFMVIMTAACSHQSIAPANNDSIQHELSAQTVVPEPQEPKNETAPKAKRIARRHKIANQKFARHGRKKSSGKTIAKNFKSRVKPADAPSKVSVAAATVQAPAAPAPEIQMPTAPAPVATLGVATEADPSADSLWNRLTNYWVLGALVAGIAALAVIAPRARRSSKPKRKLLYNG